LAVGFEDLHWADTVTWDLFEFLARNLVDEAVVLIGTYRANEISADPAQRRRMGELVQFPATLAEARELTDLGGKPLAVVTAGEGQQSGWSTAQDRLAKLSTNSVHRVVPATHESLLTDEGDAAYSARAVVDVVRSVRSRSPLPTS
jgi:hypothetical protein